LADVAGGMVDAIERAAAEAGVDVDVNLEQEFQAFALGERSAVVRLSKAAIEAMGLKPRLEAAGGGSDANVLNARGMPTVNLAAGMMRVHSPDEYLALDELNRVCELAMHLVVLAPEYARRSRSGKQEP
jgi:tripeptide aminopeptidase